jgi:methionyl-tRNA formyltransferase
MKVIFFGATKFSEAILASILENEIEVAALFTIPEFFNISYSKERVKNYNFSDLEKMAVTHNIPCYFIDSKPGMRVTDYYKIISEITPDVILLMGWYYMVPKSIREIAKHGTWGIHASLLPKYAGGAPLVWAMINGESETGVSLFKVDEGVDDGDIIAQKTILIERTDTIAEVYAKVTKESKEILIASLKNIEHLIVKNQDKSKIEVWPQRKPEDGEIDLSWSVDKIFNFIRAQSSPYPGAFIRTNDGKKMIFEKIRIE